MDKKNENATLTPADDLRMKVLVTEELKQRLIAVAEEIALDAIEAPAGMLAALEVELSKACSSMIHYANRSEMLVAELREEVRFLLSEVPLPYTHPRVTHLIEVLRACGVEVAQ
jgi:hypothetical protein